MSDHLLTDELVRRVMGWTPAPDRFLKAGRGWIPKWKFQPTKKIDDAFQLLETAAPRKFAIGGDDKGNVHVSVQIGGTTGEAAGQLKALAISCAVARALNIEVAE